MASPLSPPRFLPRLLSLLLGGLLLLARPVPVAAAMDYAKQVLIGSDFHGADLRGVTFNLTNLRDADLSGADLRGASLFGAKLQDADLSGSDLRDATLDSAVFEGTDLRNARHNAQLTRLDVTVLEHNVFDFTNRQGASGGCAMAGPTEKAV
jgi:uncharacterized protein YjbI with pentapeptide repeats